MAISYSTIVKTYEIFNAIKKEFLQDLEIPTWPADMQKWSQHEKDNPPLHVVTGWDQQIDDGWGNIFFFTKNPSPELIERFKDLANKIGNSMLCGPYKDDKPEIYVIGWF